MGVYIWMRTRTLPVFYADPPESTGSFGGDRELSIEPVGLIATMNDNFMPALVVAGALFGAAAIALSTRNLRKGSSDHFDVTGLVLGIIGLVWASLVGLRVV